MNPVDADSLQFALTGWSRNDVSGSWLQVQKSNCYLQENTGMPLVIIIQLPFDHLIFTSVLSFTPVISLIQFRLVNLI